MGSGPAKTSKIAAASETSRVKVPITSKELAKARSPKRDTLPYVGFKPTTPQKAAGWRIEPPVSEPRANTQRSAATAAADPPDEPPGTLDVSQGFLVGPKAEFSVDVPIANSSMFVLPRNCTLADFSFLITVASYAEM